MLKRRIKKLKNTADKSRKTQKFRAKQNVSQN